MYWELPTSEFNFEPGKYTNDKQSPLMTLTVRLFIKFMFRFIFLDVVSVALLKVLGQNHITVLTDCLHARLWINVRSKILDDIYGKGLQSNKHQIFCYIEGLQLMLPSKWRYIFSIKLYAVPCIPIYSWGLCLSQYCDAVYGNRVYYMDTDIRLRRQKSLYFKKPNFKKWWS